MLIQAVRAISWLICCISLVFCALPSPLRAEAPQLAWEKIGDDLEQATGKLNQDSVFSASIVLVRSALLRFNLQTIRASEYGWKHATIRSLCRAAGASVCINSNFFDEQGKALGVVISRGIIHQKAHRGGGTLTGILFATSKGVGITHRDTFSINGVVEAAQAGPRLISQGQIVPGLKESSFRTNLSGVCLDSKGRIVLYRVTAGVFGSSLPLLQNLLLSPAVECLDALNLDGGGSSQLYLAGEIPGHAGAVREENFAGRDEVPIALGLFPIISALPATATTSP